MNPSRRFPPGLWLALLALTVAVSGCHKDKSDIPSTSASASSSASPGSSASPSAAPTISTSPLYAQSSLTLVPAGGSVQLGSGGFTGTFSYPSNNLTAASTGSLVIDSNAPTVVPSPAPTGTSLLYFLFLSSANVTFTSAVGISSLTIPAADPTTGIGFAETLYDTGGGVVIGTPVTGTVSGQTVTFPSVSSASFAATGGDGYLIVISTTGITTTSSAGRASRSQ